MLSIYLFVSLESFLVFLVVLFSPQGTQGRTQGTQAQKFEKIKTV
jgi:hypothetical protein